MSDSLDFEQLFLDHLPFIDRMAAKFCRQGGMSHAEAADFASWAKERLMENDYAKVRKFRGESAFTTYVTTVLYTLYRDFQVANRGRWRASAEAKRQGSVATALERLVYRDGYSFDEAVSVLCSRDDMECTEPELRKIFKSLPSGNRGRPKEVGETPLAAVHSSSMADREVIDAESETEREQMQAKVRAVLGGLPLEDRHIVHLRFFEGSSVADIARALRLEQKPLYRRLDRLLQRLREELEGSGISASDVRELMEEDEK
jgi:RNA polymerase sigma factor for flagellar operon FliA